jgi:hypothetical protein
MQVYVDAKGNTLYGQRAYMASKRDKGEPLNAARGSRKRKGGSSSGGVRKRRSGSGKRARRK